MLNTPMQAALSVWRLLSIFPFTAGFSHLSLFRCQFFSRFCFLFILFQDSFSSSSVFHSVFCHCLSALSHSQHSSVSPFFPFFYWNFSYILSPIQLTYCYFPLTFSLFSPSFFFLDRRFFN